MSVQRTLVLIKPDAFGRQLVGAIMGRIEQKGFRFSAFKFYRPAPRQLIEMHYKQDEGKPHFSSNCDFMSQGSLLALVCEGENVLQGMRRLQGSREIPGTIRGDLVAGIQENLIHASDSHESAVREINLWFPEGY